MAVDRDTAAVLASLTSFPAGENCLDSIVTALPCSRSPKVSGANRHLHEREVRLRKVPLRRHSRSRAEKLYKASHSLHDLPAFLHDNEFILHFYRPYGLSVSSALLTLFSVHNETVNVWSHLLGFLCFLALTIHLCLRSMHQRNAWTAAYAEQLPGVLHFPNDPLSTSADLCFPHQEPKDLLAPRWPVYVFQTGAMVCLLLSSMCHLLRCCARNITRVVWRFDYVGIVVMIVASFYPPVYYMFLGQTAWRRFYLASTSVMGGAIITITLPDRFQSRQWRPIRAAMFAALGLWGTWPVLHGAVLHATVPAVVRASALDALMGATYLTGAALYALRIPERWRPGRFDLLASSHQLFHILVVVAALLHYAAAMQLLAWRDADALASRVAGGGVCAAPLGFSSAGSSGTAGRSSDMGGMNMGMGSAGAAGGITAPHDLACLLQGMASSSSIGSNNAGGYGSAAFDACGTSDTMSSLLDATADLAVSMVSRLCSTGFWSQMEHVSLSPPQSMPAAAAAPLDFDGISGDVLNATSSCAAGMTQLLAHGGEVAVQGALALLSSGLGGS